MASSQRSHHALRAGAQKIPQEDSRKDKEIYNIQRSLREIYSESLWNIIPFSPPFFLDIERKWVNMTLKLGDDLTVIENYTDLLKKAFVKARMLIIEGDPGIGKSSFMQRLAYEWTQSRLSDYDLVLYMEFRKLREYKFKDIKELITHYMKSYLDEEDYGIFRHFINDTKRVKEHKILVLLDGYDESSLERQCQELSDYFNSTSCRPLRFHVLLTSRRGYLSTVRNQAHLTFADIIGFTTERQRQEYISKHFIAKNGTESSKHIAAIIHLLNTNANLKMLSESPLMLTFICLTHEKIINGTEVELYMNIIWWMIDKYQRSNPDKDIPSLLGFEHNESDKFRVIENNYHRLPQLHLLGKMAMQDIFKTTFTETDLREFQVKEIVQEVGFIRKIITRDCSFHTKAEFSYVHRTVQEFIMALTFFFSSERPPKDFLYYVFYTEANKGYWIIPAKVQTYLDMIYCSKIKINESKRSEYSELKKSSKQLYSKSSSEKKHNSVTTTQSQDDAIDLINKYGQSLSQSSEEAVQLLHYKAKEGDASAEFALGWVYYIGQGVPQSYEEAVKWFRKSAEQENADAQYNLGAAYWNGTGVPQSDEEAVKWFRKSAELKKADAQFNLGYMYINGQGVPQSYEEAVKWFIRSAEQGNAEAQYNLGAMFLNGQGVPQSYEEAVKWFKKSAIQENAEAQYNLGNMYMNGKSTPQTNAEAVKWFRKSAEQGNEYAQCNLGVMYESGKGILQSDEEAVKWYRKSAEQGNANAQFNLGLMFNFGKGVPQSDEEAVKWYRKSAELQKADAQFNLGYMYQNGLGVPQSDEEAIKWYRKSAEQGNENAQSALKEMSEKGQGILNYFRRLIN